MIYRSFQDLQISNLAMGCMRLPLSGEKSADIDVAQVREMAAYALDHGVNYFDTAWGYHDGRSEPVMGEVLSAFPRERFYLASKFPGYDLSNMPKVREIFPKQLERCRVDYFDFYLFHNVCEKNIDAYLDPQYGIYAYLIEQKRNGRIRHLGFSCHGKPDVLRRFLEAYGSAMEFCQLQINFLDWTFQDGREKIDMLAQYGIPVWVMEPLRGGKLVSLAPVHEQRLRAMRPDETAAAWSFRFLQSIPQVVTILSGMSDLEQLKANIRTFECEKPLTQAETDALLVIADEMLSRKILPCTACRYCTEYCPQGLDIPYLLSLYNEHAFSDGGFLAPMALSVMAEDKRPSACIGCRSCEKVCPQQIGIAAAMRDFTQRLQ